MQKNIRIWLDDIREPPKDDANWTVCRSVNYAKRFILRNKDSIELVDLDHDMGDFAKYGGDGIKLLDWMLEKELNYIPVRLHTINPVGRDNMQRLIDRYWKY